MGAEAGVMKVMMVRGKEAREEARLVAYKRTQATVIKGMGEQ